ncbi:NUC173 domain-domain-containing protein [Lobosporangium transversale]|uniref:NUC173 domain-domain-containing protein n=1 Tax=Lobosporangium transversale TaxID=64571 RepID=A0A1Y2GF79_9FUNG|nr:NUC173 domain-domain-containing protein [Lobosporangium transversale]ORZ09128.1 NUC173 domain-domain-containing protein [Lobosporangium transversale]|eukprot:XP_021878755.1 NUC173 domain-domain-containing protein [Lobosporangium transversale]
MEEHFAKIRTQLSSKLPNQQMHATTLLAVEETLREQGAEITPTAYFATLMSLLDQQKDDPEVEEMRSAILNLLAIVFPNVPVSVLRSQYNPTLSVITTILALQPPPSAPSLRSLTTCLEHLLIAQDSGAWSHNTTLKALQTLLILSLDSRPKPRKRAQEAVRNIVTHPPLMMLVHPGMKIVAQTTLQVLKESGNGVVGAAGSKDKDSATQMILHTLQLVRMVGKAWPVEQFLPLCDVLLHLPKLNNPYLTSSAFQVFESLLSTKESPDAPVVVHQENATIANQTPAETMDQIVSRLEKITHVMSAVLELKPNANDATLMPLWLDVVRAGFVESARLQDSMRAAGHGAQVPQEAAVPLVQLFKTIFPNLDSSNPVSVHNSTVDCLKQLITHCITDRMIDIAVQEMKKNRGLQSDKKKRSIIETISTTIKGGFDIRFQSAWLGILDILKTLFERLNHAANPLLVSFLPIIDELRFTPAFTQKAHLDVVLSTAISTVGPRIFLDTLPLNIENPGEGKRGRAWLLPLLKNSITNTELEYFSSTLIPLADRLNLKAQECTENGMMKKVYETLIGQIWSLVSGFCDLPVDMEMAFTKELAERFSNVLYSVPDLRAVLCQALTSLVVRNQAIIDSSESDAVLERKYLMSKDEARNNITLLQQYARPYLMVFFNIFQATLPQFRGYLLEVMRMYLSISTPKDLQETFLAVLAQLNTALTTVQSPAQQGDAPPASHNLMDLADIMVAYVDGPSLISLYEAVVNLFANDADPALQKKAYKIVNSMTETETGRTVLKSNLEELIRTILETTAAATATAKRARLSLIGQVVSLLDPTDLYFVPSILSEVVVATKEVNEKTRDIAYALLVAMGNKMKAGGIISTERVGDMEGAPSETQASISEYFTMVTAGLAGTTPHMVSAAITSLSRLLFEFHKDLEPAMVSEMIGTMHLFVNSSNREIVKSALGFIKVTTVSLDAAVVRQHLQEIVSGMIRWSHEHKGHFKVKVRHILERLVRRFGYDEVVAYVPEADKKLLINIKKRRERAKRNKKNNSASGMDMDGEENEAEDDTKKTAKQQAKFGNAYEDALYGSESDLSDDEDEDEDDDQEGGNKGNKATAKKSNKKKQGADAWIKEEGDTPLDFLDRTVVSRVTASHPSSQTTRKVKDLASSFKTSSDGRLVIDDSDSDNENNVDEEEEMDQETMELDQAENNYLESLKSVDGFTRGQGGKIRFNKTNKRGALGNNENEDMDMDIQGGVGPIRRKGAKDPKQVKKIGQEFKAKKAGGDVKKKGRVDPYAYVPLTSLRKGTKEGLSLTNKSKSDKRKLGKPSRR